MVLQRIEQLWKELQTTSRSLVKQRQLIVEIHALSAEYLRLVDGPASADVWRTTAKKR